MFDVGDSLRDAIDAARSRLKDAQAAVARANAGVAAGRSADAGMAQTSHAAHGLRAAQSRWRVAR
jgi:hypothetical protein